MLESFLKQYFRQTAGAVLPIAALLLPVTLGMTALGVDTGYWVMNKRNLQTAADAAAMAAAFEIANGFSEKAEFAANKIAMENGYDPVDGDVLLMQTYENPNFTQSVNVQINYADETWFSSYFIDDMNDVVAAEATIDLSGASFCMLALDESANDAISTSGTVLINAENCGLASNSDSDTSFRFNGGVDVNIDNLHTRGGYDIVGSANLNVNRVYTESVKIPDPYEDLETPEFTPCAKNDIKKNSLSIGGSDNLTLSPGVYCGGIDISGSGDINFEPGVYIIDSGDFSISSTGGMYGEGVSFILTSSTGSYGNIAISGSREMVFSAPAEGDEMEGVLFYQDRNAPQGNGANMTNKITGSNEIFLDGVVYTPSRELTIGGSVGVDSPCTRMIARTIVLSGSPSVGNNCDDNAAKKIASISVNLTR